MGLNHQVSRLALTHQWTRISTFIKEQMETLQKIQLNLTKKKPTNRQTVTKTFHQALVN